MHQRPRCERENGEVFVNVAQRKHGGSEGGMLASSQVTAEALALCTAPSAEAFHLGNCINPHRAIHSTLARETRAITVQLYALVSLPGCVENEWEVKGNKDGELKQTFKSLHCVRTGCHI